MTRDFGESSSAISRALCMLKRIRRLAGNALISGGVFLHDDCPAGTDTAQFLQSTVRMFEEYAERGAGAKEILLGFEGEDLLFIYRHPAILCLFFKREEDLHSIETGGNQFLNQFCDLLGIQSGRTGTKATLGIHNWNEDDFMSALAPPPRPSVEVEIQPIPEDKIQALIQPREQRTAKPTIKIVPRTVHSGADPTVRPHNPTPENDEFLSRIEILFTKVIGNAQAHRYIARELEAMGAPGGNDLNKSQYLSLGQKLTGTIRDRHVRQMIESELNSLIDSL